MQVKLWLLMLAVAACATAAESVWYVAPHGSDQAPGTARQPFATPQRALQALRQRTDRGPATVQFAGGEYNLSAPLVLDSRDSGTKDAPVTWRSADGERAVLRAATPLKGWQPWRDGIYRCDLTAQGLTGVEFHQLFQRAADGSTQRLTLARHPNADPKQPRYGGFCYAADTAKQANTSLVYGEGDLPWDQWPDISQAELVSTYNLGWMFAVTPISKVDQATRTITFRKVRGRLIKLNRYFIQNVLGALDAPGEWYLDRNESVLYLKPVSGQVKDGEILAPTFDNVIELRGSLPYNHRYLNTSWQGPREGVPENDHPVQPVEHVTFRELNVECARQDGIRLTGARWCEVVRCRFTNLGNIGVNLGGSTSSFAEVGNPRVEPGTGEPLGAGGGGQILLLNDPCFDCRVVGCDVNETGCEGIMLFGRRNVADNCHVWDIGRYAKDAPCINLLGEANVARRSTLHDCPRCCIFIKGEDNVAELNDCHHANLETTDMGVIRFVQRNAFLKGNLVRHNLVTDSVGYGFSGRDGGTHYESPFYTWGIYLDDYTCGTIVEGNLIARTGRGGVMIHGGGDNLVANNIIYNAGGYQIEFAPIRTDGAGGKNVFAGNRVERNILVSDQPGQYPYRFTRWVEDHPVYDHNLLWAGGPDPIVIKNGKVGIEQWSQWLDLGFETASLVADPKLRDAVHDDFHVAADSPAWKLGFKPIPYDQIGCYADAARVSWPVTPNRERPREQPVLYHVPGYQPVPSPTVKVEFLGPIHDDFEDVTPGTRPRHGDVLAPPPSVLAVTDKLARTGKQCLEFVDAEGLKQDFAPRIYYSTDFGSGTVRLGFDLRLDPATPPTMYVDCRQYSATGATEFFSGPVLHLSPSGELIVGKDVLTKLPLAQWVRCELRIPLGEATSKLTITPQGGPSATYDVPHSSAKFARLERVVIASLSKVKTVFCVDDLVLEEVEE